MIEGLLDVLAETPVLEVAVGEQDLPDLDAAGSKQPLVLADEPRLANGGAHLYVVCVLWPGGKPQRLDSGGDRARRDEDDLAAGSPERADSVDDAAEGGPVRAACPVGYGMGPDLDDDPAHIVLYAHGRILYHILRTYVTATTEVRTSSCGRGRTGRGL